MRSAEIFMHGIAAGILEEIEAGNKYRFAYFERYNGPSIALTQKSIEHTVSRIVNAFPRWTELIQKCYLSDPMKTQYIDLLNERFSTLDLKNRG